jgi:hypothetical protein
VLGSKREHVRVCLNVIDDTIRQNILLSIEGLGVSKGKGGGVIGTLAVPD